MGTDPFEKMLLQCDIEPRELLNEIAWPGTYSYMLRPGEDGVRYDTDEQRIFLTPNRIQEMQRRTEREKGETHYKSGLIRETPRSDFLEDARKTYDLMQDLEDRGYRITAEYTPASEEELGDLLDHWDDRYLRLERE